MGPRPHNTPLRASGQAAWVPVLCCGTSLWASASLCAKRAPFLSDPWGSEKQRSGSVCCIVSGGNLGTFFTELSVGARPWQLPHTGSLSSGTCSLLRERLALEGLCLHGYLRGLTTWRLCSLGGPLTSVPMTRLLQ